MQSSLRKRFYSLLLEKTIGFLKNEERKERREKRKEGAETPEENLSNRGLLADFDDEDDFDSIDGGNLSIRSSMPTPRGTNVGSSPDMPRPMFGRDMQDGSFYPFPPNHPVETSFQPLVPTACGSGSQRPSSRHDTIADGIHGPRPRPSCEPPAAQLSDRSNQRLRPMAEGRLSEDWSLAESDRFASHKRSRSPTGEVGAVDEESQKRAKVYRSRSTETWLVSLKLTPYQLESVLQDTHAQAHEPSLGTVDYAGSKNKRYVPTKVLPVPGGNGMTFRVPGYERRSPRPGTVTPTPTNGPTDGNHRTMGPSSAPPIPRRSYGLDDSRNNHRSPVLEMGYPDTIEVRRSLRIAEDSAGSDSDQRVLSQLVATGQTAIETIDLTAEDSEASTDDTNINQSNKGHEPRPGSAIQILECAMTEPAESQRAAKRRRSQVDTQVVVQSPAGALESAAVEHASRESSVDIPLAQLSRRTGNPPTSTASVPLLRQGSPTFGVPAEWQASPAANAGSPSVKSEEAGRSSIPLAVLGSARTLNVELKADEFSALKYVSVTSVTTVQDLFAKVHAKVHLLLAGRNVEVLELRLIQLPENDCVFHVEEDDSDTWKAFLKRVAKVGGEEVDVVGHIRLSA